MGHCSIQRTGRLHRSYNLKTRKNSRCVRCCNYSSRDFVAKTLEVLWTVNVIPGIEDNRFQAQLVQPIQSVSKCGGLTPWPAGE